MNLDKYAKILYLLSAFLVVLGLVMMIFSLAVIIPAFSVEALIIPAICFIIALIGFIAMKSFKKKIK